MPVHPAFLPVVPLPVTGHSRPVLSPPRPAHSLPRAALAKPPSSTPSSSSSSSPSRSSSRKPSSLARASDAAPYIGTPPPAGRGRLRFSPITRFRTTPASPPPEETRRDTGWQRATLVSRSVSIWTFIGRLLFSNWLSVQPWTVFPISKPSANVLASRRRDLAAFARQRMLRLGPTMVKVGQLASARADLLPREVVDELRLLQDAVPAFPWTVAEQLLEEEYGRPVAEVFEYFDKIPIAAASLGQVHRAVLPTGEHVVVKIQRPKLRGLFDKDLLALKLVARYLERSKTYGGKDRDWMGIYEEASRVLYEEIDYVREAESCRRFGDNFRDAGIDWVKVPIAFPEYTTERVLCLQYLPGIKISDRETLLAAGLDTSLVANRVANAFIRQVLDFAFFSSDPHPGNVAVGPNETIIFYDFGMMGELNPRIKDRLIDILAGVLDRDAEIVMNALVDLDALVLPADPSPVRRAIQFFLDSIGTRPSRDQTVSAIGDDLYATAYDRPFRLPAASIFLLRAFSTLEGLATGLDPKFKFSEVALPYADELLRDRAPVGAVALSSPGTLARSLARSVLTGQPNALSQEFTKAAVGTGTGAVRAVSRIEKMEKTLSKLERGDIKLRSRSTETEKLLRKQYSLSEASNYLLSTGTTALAATQLYAAGSVEPAAAMATFSAVLGLMFLRKQAKLNKKDRFSS